jgi:hypothetical protein
VLTLIPRDHSCHSTRELYVVAPGAIFIAMAVGVLAQPALRLDPIVYRRTAFSTTFLPQAVSEVRDFHSFYSSLVRWAVIGPNVAYIRFDLNRHIVLHVLFLSAISDVASTFHVVQLFVKKS